MSGYASKGSEILKAIRLDGTSSKEAKARTEADSLRE
jgi:hypothetical protein